MSKKIASSEIDYGRRLTQASTLAVALFLTACGKSDSQEITLSFSKLTTNNKCLGGGDRPCFEPLRTEPKLSNDPNDPTKNYVNKGPIDKYGRLTAVDWPLESYNRLGTTAKIR